MGLFSKTEYQVLVEEGVKFSKTDFRKALNYFDRAIKLEPSNLLAISNKASLLNNKGMIDLKNNEFYEAESNFRESLKLSENALKIYPDNNKIKNEISITFNNLGLTFFQKGQLPKALSYFHKSLKYDSWNRDANHNKKELLKKLKGQDLFKGVYLKYNYGDGLEDYGVYSSYIPHENEIIYNGEKSKTIELSEVIIELKWAKVYQNTYFPEKHNRFAVNLYMTSCEVSIIDNMTQKRLHKRKHFITYFDKKEISMTGSWFNMNFEKINDQDYVFRFPASLINEYLAKFEF